jgi:polar amino acid transport system substrate-binding protein
MAPGRSLIAALVLAAACPGALAAGCSKPIIAVTEQWPEKTFSKNHEGADMEMARAIIKEAGCSLVEGPVLPVVRRMQMFADGKFDLMLAASDIPERRSFARFSATYRMETVGLFSLEKSYEDLGDIDSFETLDARKVRLLVPTIGWYGPEYERRRGALEAAGRLSRFGTNAQGLRMLAARRGQLIMGDTMAMNYQSKLLGIPVRQLGFVVMRSPVHLMFSRATITEADVGRINAAIARLEKNGTLRAIGQRYGIN